MNSNYKNLVGAVQVEKELNAARDSEVNKMMYADSVLTPEEQAAVDKMAEESAGAVMVNEDDKGVTSEVPVVEALASLDAYRATVSNGSDATDVIKLLSHNDILETADGMKKAVRSKMVATSKALANKDLPDDVDDDDFIRINNEALEILRAHFGIETITSDIITRRLSKMPLSEIVKILPQEFIDIYISGDDISTNNSSTRDVIVTTLAYFCVTGPEAESVNKYVDEEHAMMALGTKLMQCSIDMSEAIKSPEKISELAARVAVLAPEDTSFWSKYIPGGVRRISNMCAQRIAINEEFSKGYEALIPDYTAAEDATEKERDISIRSVELIQEEIDECAKKIEIYSSILELEEFKRLWSILVDRYLNNKKGNKKCNKKYLIDEGVRAIKRIRRSKVNLPFPVYDEANSNSDARIFDQYMTIYPSYISEYNKTITDILEKNTDEETVVKRIHSDDIEDESVHWWMSLMLLILFGRLVKRYDTNTSDKYDAVTLDTYFNMYCRLCSDIYVATDVWNIICEDIGRIIGAYDLTTK